MQNMNKIVDIILLEESILEKYGLFYLHESKKHDWLESSDDKGEKYYKLYDKIIHEKDVKFIKAKLKDAEVWFEDIITSTITDPEDKKIYDESYTYFENAEPAKTKLAKLTRNLNTSKLDALSNKYSLALNTYVYIKFGVKVPYKFVKKCESQFDVMFIEYKELSEKYKNACKYVSTKRKYLSDKLECFNNGSLNLDKFKYNTKQITEFKNSKWSELREPDRIERLGSYINSIYPDRDNEFITRINEQVVDLYKKKILKFNNIKWSRKHGYIRDITNLDIDHEFNVSIDAPIKKITIRHNTVQMFKERANEEILYYILTCNKSIDQCIYKIQHLLKIHKISHVDRKKLARIYNEFARVISENPFSEFDF